MTKLNSCRNGSNQCGQDLWQNGYRLLRGVRTKNERRVAWLGGETRLKLIKRELSYEIANVKWVVHCEM